MKYFEPTYWIMMNIALVNWLMSSLDLFSKIAALVIAIMTIFYLNEKRKGQKLDNELKKKELDGKI